MNKTKEVYVILSNPENSSCLVNSVYLNKKKAERWIHSQNRKLGFRQYDLEISQLIK